MRRIYLGTIDDVMQGDAFQAVGTALWHAALSDAYEVVPFNAARSPKVGVDLDGGQVAVLPDGTPVLFARKEPA